VSSKCEDHYSFLSFYSKTKVILLKLNIGNLIAVKDSVFLKAYFSMVIEATELQTEVKDFLRNIFGDPGDDPRRYQSSNYQITIT